MRALPPRSRRGLDRFVLRGGRYRPSGPDGFAEQRGYPKVVSSSAKSHDAEVQKRLWAVSEELTGVVYPAAELAHGKSSSCS